MSASAVPTVVLQKRRALPFFSHHPWVFAGAIHSLSGDPGPGAEVRVQSFEGRFIGRGLYNPDSQIRVRLYGWEEARPFDAGFWAERIEHAVQLRERMFADDAARACRLIFSEGDHLSGLTVDRYGDWLLMQWTSRALATRQAEIVEILQQRLQPRGIWLRTEKGIGEAEGLETADGLIRGDAPERPLLIREHGLRYGVDVVEGQKTGFYFDQRDNRAAVARYVRGRRVLDAFSYTGAFGLCALQLGEAAHVTCVDSSAPALDAARSNAEENGLHSRCELVRSDVAPYLEAAAARGERFGAIVLDPPKMARTRSGLERAAKGYARLNRLALAVLEPGGILASCSCSGLVERELFLDILAESALDAGRELQLLEVRGQAADHPVSAHCRESAYLKCVIARAN